MLSKIHQKLDTVATMAVPEMKEHVSTCQLPICTFDALLAGWVADSEVVPDEKAPVAMTEDPAEVVAPIAAGLPGSAYARIYLISK